MSQLFRPEVFQQKKDRLSGSVSIAVPLSWQAIGFLIFGGLVIAIVFLSLASYARVEIVSGAIVPDKGVAAIIPSRPGTITQVLVADGDAVAKGDTLVTIRAEEDSASGVSAAALTEQAIAQQDGSLLAQMAAAERSAEAQQSQLLSQANGLRAEIEQLQSQIVLQQNLVGSASIDLEKAQAVAERGFISRADLRAREDTLLARQQQLSQLQQSLGTRRATLTQLSASAASITAQAQSDLANIAAVRAQVAQQAASNAGARSYALTAPVAGVITALTMRSGQRVSSQNQIMAVIPTNARLRAELLVPSQAIGFVKRGQDVRLAIDAFPYQRFGTVTGRITTVATSAVSQALPSGAVLSAYPVVVEIERPEVIAFGRREKLVSGMTLTARIITERQSLIEWLFEPLFAVRRRS